MAESVTENFFGKLRHLATTLEKETKQLEREFNPEDTDPDYYEDTCPMKVLHDLHSEIRTLKADVQVTIDRANSKEQDLVGFLKACKLLKQKTKSDLEQIKDVFEQYGYKPPPVVENSGTEQGMDNLKCNVSGKNSNYPPESENIEDMPVIPGLEKIPAQWDFLNPPLLSDFGLSHYQFRARWDAMGDIPFKTKTTLTEEPKNVSKVPSDSLVVTMPKTPKSASRMGDESYSLSCENVAIDDYSVNLGDDYTMVLLNKKVLIKTNVPQSNDDECNMASISEKIINHVPTTPAPLMQLSQRKEDIHSPVPPAFCTPGLITVKHENKILAATPESEEQGSSDHREIPNLPQFETPWLNKYAVVNAENTTQEVPKMEALSNKLCTEEPAPLTLSSDVFHENPVGLLAPPNISDYEDFLATPKCPVLASETDDFKIWGDDKLFGMPQRPKLTACTTEDKFKISPVNAQSQKSTTEMKVNSKVTERFGKKMISEDHDKENQSFLACLAPVSEREYSSQPSYLRRQNSLADINRSLQKINALLNRKQMEGNLDISNVIFKETELRSLLEMGPQSRIILMSLAELHRLEEVESLDGVESQDENLYRALINV